MENTTGNKMYDEIIIPKWFFNDRNLVTINLPFPNQNEKFSKKFCVKIENYINDKVRFSIV